MMTIFARSRRDRTLEPETSGAHPSYNALYASSTHNRASSRLYGSRHGFSWHNNDSLHQQQRRASFTAPDNFIRGTHP